MITTLINHLNLTLGDQKVCFDCWCAVAGMRTDTDMIRKKDSTEKVITAYTKGDEVYLKPDGSTRGRSTRDRPADKLTSAISFLAHFVSESAGNVQHLVPN